MGESRGGWGRVGAGKKRESSEELVLAGFGLVDCTRMFLWAYGCMVIWVYVFMVVWLYGYMGVCFYGRMVVWLYGCTCSSGCGSVYLLELTQVLFTGQRQQHPPSFLSHL